MSNDRWIVVPNWDKFQHYTDRDPPWIKLWTGLNSKDEWLGLSTAARGMLATIWVEYARSGGVLRVETAMGLCGNSARTSHLESLNHAGFIELSASKPSRARSREKEIEKEKKELVLTHKSKTAVDESSKANAEAYQKYEPEPQLEPLPVEQALELIRRLAHPDR